MPRSDGSGAVRGLIFVVAARLWPFPYSLPQGACAKQNAFTCHALASVPGVAYLCSSSLSQGRGESGRVKDRQARVSEWEGAWKECTLEATPGLASGSTLGGRTRP